MVKRAFLFVLSLISTFALPCFAVDKALVGLWQATVKKPDGAWEIRWDIQPGGSFHCTMKGPHGAVDDSGQLNADTGHWSKWSKTGSDSGSYTIIGTDKFSMVGALGPSQWTRVGSGAQSIPSYTASTTPSAAHTPSYSATASYTTTSPSYTPSSNPSYSVPTVPQASYSQPGSVAQTSNQAQTNNANWNERRNPSKFKRFINAIALPPPNSARPYNAYNNSPVTNAQPNNAPLFPSPPVMKPGMPGYGTSYYPNAWAGNPNWRAPDKNSGAAPMPANVAGADAKSLLLDQFPLPPASDEAEQFGLPGLARTAGSGMRRRQFRTVM